ncbi:MAG: IclR family transcriptional regulator [Rubrobacteraceae bacterium]
MDSVDERGKGSKVVASGVGVLDKAVAILTLLSEGGPASLAGVVGGTGLPRPTAYRLLSALEKHHLVAKHDGRYALGSRLLGWGNRAGVSPDLIEAARPVLAKLRNETDESTQLYVREGEQRVCVAIAERGTGLKTTVAVGAVMPLELGSAGKVLLAFSSPDASHGAKLALVHEQGWAESVAEREAGVASVSAPVFGPDGRLKAAVSASGPISRLGDHPGEWLAEHVISAAREIEAALGS